MVGSSKKFFDPTIYAFTLAAYYTFNGGRSWNEAPALELLANWAGTSDPAVACDNMGNAFLVALPFSPGTPTDFTGPVIGIAVYKSPDGGQSWSPPNLIHASAGDDKQWAAADNSPASPYQGNVYAVWDNGSQLAFARTLDHGASWAGVGAQSVGSPLAFDSFAPDISVAADGTVFIVWVAGSAIKFVKSTDGGNSFSAPAIAVSGITPVPGQLPGGKFRVFTLPAGCAGTGGTVVFAWADMREGVSRIYYCFSNDSGTRWQGGPSGQPLLPGWLASRSNQHDFHPQLVTTPDGRIGCAFYEFGPKWWWWWWPWPPWGPLLIDVVLSISTDNGATFSSRETVTSQPWDPTIDAPFAHGSPNVTFIGDYFGLAGSSLGFFPFWTDTRTGMQEIFAGYQPPWWCLWCWFFCWFWGWSWGWRSWFVHARVWWRRRAYRRRQRQVRA